MSFTGIPELKNSYRALGAVRFCLMMAGTLLWIGAGAGLSIALRYPQAYGSSCHRKCLIESFWYSPALIRHGGLLEWLLLIWLWSIPAAILAALIYRVFKRDPLSNKILSE